ncbi:hypothetical protein OG562_24080 [Streptomyces sp. NBC_01275]|uniref:hypothetical protein n=1 Tax=Streptomyces sp. NBC_01275 TaxID=2903807 RepID=UPI002251DB6F|nr:hypothetical protein [Streptomyces sp. NBC_01275]MCX4763983.1 hypothetical protein [Streptomyces sp. NBC_01275]
MLLCTAAAQRGSAFCRVLGSAEQQSWLDSGLELAWSAAAGEEVADECAELLDALDALDVLDAGDDEGEAYEGHGGYDDDPTARPGFYADQAVGLVGEALAMSIRPSAERVETVLKTLRTLLSMVDFKLGGEKPVIVRGGEPRPAPGPLVQREEDAEREVLAAPAVAEAQESAQAFVAEVTPSVEEFAEASHWD